MPPLLTSAAELAASLDDPALRILDASVYLRREVPGGPYRVQSGRPAYLAGHVPGAAFADVAIALSEPASPFPLTLPSPQRFADGAGALGIGPGTRVVAYSQHSPMWATRLWWLLRYFGFDQVSVLDGGLPAWVAAGLELQAGERSYEPAPFHARPRPELLARRADVEQVVAGSRPACLVNALPAEAFRGDGPGAYSRPGRIPGSVSLHWERLVDRSSGLFLRGDELARALGPLGDQGTAEVIAYCGGGISATVDVFAMELAGRTPARLYDGSLTEWSADPSLPLEIG